MSVYAKLAAALALLAAFAGYSWYVLSAGKRIERADWMEKEVVRKAAENSAILSRVKNNERIAEQQILDNRRITKAHNEELIQVRADIGRAAGLRPGAAICAGFAAGAEAAGSGGSDAADTEGRMVRPDVQRDIDAMKVAVEEALAAGRACQAFVTSNDMAP